MIVKKSLSEQIYESIKQDIMEQRIMFGGKLSNRDLRTKYGVSSTPVRDAINRLHQDGLLEDISNVGARVITFDFEMAVEINEIVAVLSCGAAELSAKKASLQQILPKLKDYLQLQVEYADHIDYFNYDRAFHQTFFDFSFNERYKRLYKQYQALWQLLVKYYHQDKESTRSHAISQHQQILTAYESGDITLVQQHLRHHYQEAVHSFRKTLA